MSPLMVIASSHAQRGRRGQPVGCRRAGKKAPETAPDPRTVARGYNSPFKSGLNPVIPMHERIF